MRIILTANKKNTQLTATKMKMKMNSWRNKKSWNWNQMKVEKKHSATERKHVYMKN
jgi:hypothetical protein